MALRLFFTLLFAITGIISAFGGLALSITGHLIVGPMAVILAVLLCGVPIFYLWAGDLD